MNKEYYEKKLHTEFVRRFPSEEGRWKIVSSGEVVLAVEIEDIQGYPMMAVETEEGMLLDSDFFNEIFVKLDKNGQELA